MIEFSNMGKTCISIIGEQVLLYHFFKGGTVEDPKNYRGITLQTFVIKSRNRLTKWYVKHRKTIDNQFGFHKGKSTTDCILLLHSLIVKSLAEGKKQYYCCLDFKICVDKFDRTFIFQKLLS
jgi:hypothetical protein